MKIDLNDNFKWFLESLLNEGFDQFFIDDMYGAMFTKNGKITSIDTVNFVTSNFYKACPDLEENTEYNIKDFIEGKLVDNSYEFGDKIIVTINNTELDGVFIRKEDRCSIVIIKDVKLPIRVTNKAVRKAE